MTTIRDLLRTKGNQVWSIGPQASIEEALRLMAERRIGALTVLEEGRIAGIFSERDFARQIIAEDAISLKTPVREAMTHPVLYIEPDQSIEDCMKLMTARRIRHVPVLEGERLVGLISIGDVVKELISEKDTQIKQLENYILGSELIS